MRAYPRDEIVQTLGCEVLGLLAGGPDGLEQTLFDADAIPCCLDACAAFPRSEGVLGGAFQAVANICYATDGGREVAGCARKQYAVDLGLLELVCHHMRLLPRSKWVQEAGVIAIGCLCNGADIAGEARRMAALNCGAIEYALQVSERFTTGRAMPSHEQAYTAAVYTVRQVGEVDGRYDGPPIGVVT